jgi:hypothetical protein
MRKEKATSRIQIATDAVHKGQFRSVKEYLLALAANLYGISIEAMIHWHGGNKKLYLDVIENGAKIAGETGIAALAQAARTGRVKQLLTKKPNLLGRTPLEISEKIDRIHLLTAAATGLADSLPKVSEAKTYRSRLSPGKIEYVRAHFRELKNAGLPDDKAFIEIQREFEKQKIKVSKTTIRRVCDEKFAQLTGCFYGRAHKPRRKQHVAIIATD